MTTAFFRADDVGEWTEELDAVTALFVELEVPVNYQVIPVRLDEASAARLRDLHARHPSLVHLNQHGYRHEQVIGGEHRWSEFAGGRPYEEQRADIAAGKELLAKLLGDAAELDVFTPPQHKYDRETLRALADEDFRIVSASYRPDLGARAGYAVGSALGRTTVLGRAVSQHGRVRTDVPLLELSVSVLLDDAVRVSGGVDRWLTAFEEARSRTDAVGLMLHHAVYDDVASLGELVLRLRERPDVEFVAMGAR
jgi:hypothetical protein